MRRNASRNFFRRLTAGVEPDAVKVASPVLNGGDEEMYPQGNAPCRYPTKLSTGGLLWSWRNAKERFVMLSDHGEGPQVLSRVR